MQCKHCQSWEPCYDGLTYCGKPCQHPERPKMPETQSQEISSWPRYTLTGFIGLVAGLMTTYTSMTISNQSRIAALEAISQANTETLRRIEAKLDRVKLIPKE